LASLSKKTLHPKNQLREDVQQRRKDWWGEIKSLAPRKLLFLDETSVNCGMTRPYGRAKKGERVNDYVPDARFERTSVISTIRIDGRQAPMMFKGTLDGNVFAAYVKDVLAPALEGGETVIMDNLASHKVKGALDPIYEKGATVLFLPAYSPDYNPIEQCWSKMKAVLRKLKAKTYDGLTAAMKSALDSVAPSDIAGWFKHCGYEVT
jgi:transposase